MSPRGKQDLVFLLCYACFYIWGCWMSTNSLIYCERSFWKVRNAFRCTCTGSPAGGALFIVWAAPGLCGGEDTFLCLSSILHMASRQCSCHSPPHPALGSICTCTSAQISFNTAASPSAAHKVAYRGGLKMLFLKICFMYLFILVVGRGVLRSGVKINNVVRLGEETVWL